MSQPLPLGWTDWAARLVLAVIISFLFAARVSSQEPPDASVESEPLNLNDRPIPTDGTAESSASESADLPNERVPSNAFDLLRTERLTGEWGGLRTHIEDAGLTLRPTAVVVYEHNARGGLNTHKGGELAGMFMYDVQLDFEKMNLARGATFFLRAVQTWSDGIQSDVGSDSRPHLYVGDWGHYFYGDEKCILIDKWWYRQFLLDDRIEVRLGKILPLVDLFDNSEYASNPVGSFMNSNLMLNATIPIGFGLGGFIKIWPTDWVYFQMSGVDAANPPDRTGFDTAFHGDSRFMGNWELGFLPAWLDGNERGITSRYKIGWWYDPVVRDVFRDDFGGRIPTRSRGDDVGYYLCADQQLWKENADPRDTQGLGVCVRYGYARGDINRYRHFWSVAAVWEGLIPERDKDALGFGVAQGIVSSQYRHEIDSRADRETVYELYYRYEVTPWLALTPDVQIITNPGGTKDGRDSLILGLRAKIAF